MGSKRDRQGEFDLIFIIRLSPLADQEILYEISVRCLKSDLNGMFSWRQEISFRTLSLSSSLIAVYGSGSLAKIAGSSGCPTRISTG